MTVGGSALLHWVGVIMESAQKVFQEYLKAQGMVRSQQREQILDVFLGIEAHTTIDDLHARVKKKHPKIGLATVYRAMKVICDAGLADEADFGDGIRRFEHKYRHQHHDHLVCTECGQLIEVVCPEIEKLQEDLAQQHGFTPVRHEMQIFGLCRKCGEGKSG